MDTARLEGQGTVVGKRAPDFTLEDQEGRRVTLSERLKKGSVLLVFYPGDFTMVCTKQMCNYQDRLADFERLGIQVIGVSRNSKDSHSEFVNKYSFSFDLLSDPGNAVTKKYGCTSLLMLGSTTRAVFIIHPSGVILYRYVEPTPLTRRTADELVAILSDLKEHKLL